MKPLDKTKLADKFIEIADIDIQLPAIFYSVDAEQAKTNQSRIKLIKEISSTFYGTNQTLSIPFYKKISKLK